MTNKQHNDYAARILALWNCGLLASEVENEIEATHGVSAYIQIINHCFIVYDRNHK